MSQSLNQLYVLGLCDNVLRCGRWVLVPRTYRDKAVPCPHCKIKVGSYVDVTDNQVRLLLDSAVADVIRSRPPKAGSSR